MSTGCDDNRQRQLDELVALKAIFGDSAIEQDHDSSEHISFLIHAPLDTAEAHADIQFHLPVTYPSNDPPLFEWICARDVRANPANRVPGFIYPSRQLVLNPAMLNDIETELQRMWKEDMCQDVVIFGWISWLDSYFSEHWPQPLNPIPLPKDKPDLPASDNSVTSHSLSPSNTLAGDSPVAADNVPSIYTGVPLEMKKSVFVAHVARVKSAKDVQLVLDSLMQDKKIAQATHNILAYRVRLDSGSISQDNDDDGETAAGKRLGHLLQLLDIVDIMVVVTRWYGGVHLGPDRFKLINNAARQALESGGFIGN
ncbi:hypothetical protein GGI15_000920 [Coemansia interrupta]|uniref:RWD domain-containing protein n=1 Tax=Coemansia interrupta TaxID=1126814 RepID=A0A9W8LP41_9FUNG|nr:hypothetical protein GGI15_000920 [Coemansia interrupta]